MQPLCIHGNSSDSPSFLRKPCFGSYLVAAVCLALVIQGIAVAADFDLGPLLDGCNVSWNIPGPSSQQSMPVGNGDIGLNVWVEPSGDLGFYIGKTDSWGEQNQGPRGLMKVGGGHIAITPGPLASGASFAQVLHLHEGEIDIREGDGDGEVDLRVWVDANHPAIRIEMTSGKPVSCRVTLDDWRKEDIVKTLPNQANQIVWYHRNPSDSKVDPHLANLTFGAVMSGEGLVGRDQRTLESSTPTTSQLVTIVPLTAVTDTPEQWLSRLGALMAEVDALDLEQTRLAHRQWWDAFWHRSWIFATGPQEADEVTRGYVLQRFITACAGRGAYPIKFNGSIFVVDDPFRTNKTGDATPVDADYRDWGGQYWFQNTRALYWPRLEAGDFDEMMPLFKMYEAMMKANEPVVRAYYGHGGSCFAEVTPFWGGLKYAGPEMPENWNDLYFTDILDLGMMMLDYVEYTGDTQFEKETAIPMISAGLTFFNEHFYPGPDGKLLLDPDNAIEMYWKASNPAPDIAGLHAILARMIALPDDLVDAATRDEWQKMESILPDLPTGVVNGKKVLLPYEGPQTMKMRNTENPELYAIYPFRLYGLERPDLDLAIQTFYARKCKGKGCWVQDPIQAAMLGLTDIAKEYVHFNFLRTDPHLKFPAFWAHGNDYMPDEDNGGNGENGLQQMLLQPVGRKLLLFPAWPKDWNAEFKLNAPFQTTVQGRVVDGKLAELVVNPPERADDVIDMSLRPASAASASSSNGNLNISEK